MNERLFAQIATDVVTRISKGDPRNWVGRPRHSRPTRHIEMTSDVTSDLALRNILARIEEQLSGETPGVPYSKVVRQLILNRLPRIYPAEEKREILTALRDRLKAAIR